MANWKKSLKISAVCERPKYLKKIVFLGVLYGHFGDSLLSDSNSTFNSICDRGVTQAQADHQQLKSPPPHNIYMQITLLLYQIFTDLKNDQIHSEKSELADQQKIPMPDTKVLPLRFCRMQWCGSPCPAHM